MAFYSALALTGGALAVGAVARRKPTPPRLVDALIDGEPKQATLLPPKQQQALPRVQQMAQDLFGSTRQQYQQALNTTYDVSAEQRTEQVQKQNLLMATSGLGLGIAGALVAPIFYLPSVICSLYSFRMPLQEVYRVFVEERRFDYRAVWAITLPAALAGGHVVAAAFGNLFFLLNIFLMAKTENRSKQSIADLFGGQIRTVWLLIEGVEVETPFEQVQVGDTVVVHAGQMIPVDGTITTGTATIDQHMLTGESQPAEKGEGDPSGTWAALVMRTDTAPFDDVRVRQAMRLVADRQQIIDLVLNGAGTVTCDTPVAPSDVYRWEGDCAQDIEGAKALLAEAGYADGLDVTLYTSDSSQEQIPMAEVYQQQAAAAGINVNLEIAPSDSFWSDVWRVEPLVTTFWHERPADEILNLNWRSTAAWNESYYQDAAFDQLLDEARTALDFEPRRATYQAAQQLLHEEGGHLIPFHVDSFNVASAELSGVSARSWPHIEWHLISKSE